MKIAVDVRPLCHPGTGIYRYTFELLKRMVAMGGEWYFYSVLHYDQSNFQQPNVHHRVAGVPAFVRASQLGLIVFPLWARKDKAEVFWGPRHQLPMALPKKIRAVVTIHDLVWKRFGETMRFPGRQIEAFTMPKALQRADEVVAVSKFTRTELKRYFPIYTENVKIVAGASHMSSIEEKFTGLDQSAGKYFLFVGTMEPRKNLQRLLKAYAAYISHTEVGMPLKIVGRTGWGGIDAQKIISELSLDDSVTLIGLVDEQDLKHLYAGAYALLMPSLYEGFGLPVIEALSQGVPVICSEDSAMSEIGGDACILVDPESELDIYRALLRIESDSKLHEELAAQARSQASRYDWQQSACRLFSILEGAAADRASDLACNSER